jgi:hypothetical protein
MNHFRTSYIRVLYNKTQVWGGGGGKPISGKNDPPPFLYAFSLYSNIVVAVGKENLSMKQS